MKLGISLLNPGRLLAGLQVKKGIEPLTSETEMEFQPIVIITIGFVFGYMEVIFNNGKAVSMKDAVNEFKFEKIGSFKDEDEFK